MDGTLPTPPQARARRCAALALALVALLGGAAAPARAAGPAETWPADGAAMRTAIEVGRAHWGGMPCRGAVAPEWRDLDPSLNAQALWTNPESMWQRPDLNGDCELQLNVRAAWDWPKLCTVVVHELGHLMGHQHADRPDDVMYAYYVAPVADCLAEPEPAAGPAAARAGSAVHLRSRRRVAPRGGTPRRRAAHRAHRRGRAPR